MNDVSSNDTKPFEEEISEDVSFEEDSPEEELDSVEGVENESETYNTISVDYSSYFENLQNSFDINNALLLACILLIGVLMGLKNER